MCHNLPNRFPGHQTANILGLHIYFSPKWEFVFIAYELQNKKIDFKNLKHRPYKLE